MNWNGASYFVKKLVILGVWSLFTALFTDGDAGDFLFAKLLVADLILGVGCSLSSVFTVFEGGEVSFSPAVSDSSHVLFVGAVLLTCVGLVPAVKKFLMFALLSFESSGTMKVGELLRTLPTSLTTG